MKKFLAVLSFAFLANGFLFGQDLKFTRIGSDQGLSQASVICILQDSRGFMWFGTQDGLNRYNGYEMAVYKHDASDSTSISHNYIECLYEDQAGTIWIGTRGGGLNAYDPVKDQFRSYKNDPEDSTSISYDIVKCIYQDKKGVYWIGTTYGLNSFDGKNDSFKRYLYNDEDTLSVNGFKVHVIYEDRKGRFWVGTHDGGLNLFDRDKETFRRYIDPSDQEGHEFMNRVLSLAEDQQGIFWIATDNGGMVTFHPEKKVYLNRYKKNKEAPEQSISDNSPNSLTFDSRGALWIATKYGGLSLLAPGQNKFAHYRHNEYDSQSISNDKILCVYRDREGNMWLGTETGGANVYFPGAARFKHYKKDVSNEAAFKSNAIFAILQDRDGLIWVGTQFGGITTIDRDQHLFGNLSGPESPSNSRSNSVLSLFEDKDGLIYVGTWGAGLSIYDKVTKKTSRLIETGAITCIAQGRNDIIWIGAYGRGQGLFGYTKGKKEMLHYTMDEGLSSNDIFSIYEDQKNVWIGTGAGGLNRLDIRTGKVTVYQFEKNKNSICDNTVNCIYDDRKGGLWLGTSNGLSRFDISTQSFTNYSEKDGLPNASIWGVIGDKRGNLWISTNKGVSRFNPGAANREGSAFRNFTPRDGLQGEEYAQGSHFLGKKTGEIFFGGINGFNSFYPDQITDNKHIPPVLITSFKKFGKEVQLDSNITSKKFIELSYRDNFISFEFVALDYIFPAKNKYSFKMEGLDPDWSPPSNRRYVSYTNLPGGDYVFRVRASNSDGIWNETGTSIHIRVIPPWWKTNTFYAGSILFSIAFVFVFIRMRTAKIEKEKKVLEQKVAERTAELAQKNKDITSSIQYAKRIQDAILPTRDQIQKHFPESFVLFKPKDIVSGDFYWFGEKNGRKIAACVDCTGHGVPGAFMSMIGTNLLNQIIYENGVVQPSAILAALNQGVRTALKQGMQSENETTDGMDISLCSIDLNTRELQFSSALRHLVILSNGKLEKIDGNKFPIGGAQWNTERNFTNHLKFLNKGDMIYMFSDGYADQFGGEKGKKFMIKHLHSTLTEVHSLPIADQKQVLDARLETWKGEHSQVDDVLVIGIRI